jgi:hypothetical protein
MSTRKFDSLTPRGKAVRVAKDVLQQLKVKKLIATQGKYFDFGATNWSIYDYSKNDDMKHRVAASHTCQVCALGSAICGYANLNGPVNISTAYSGTDIKNTLGGVVFTRQNLGEIEPAFELDHAFSDREGVSREDACKAVKFGKKYKTPENRLRAIMNNIIQNRGVFKP